MTKRVQKKATVSSILKKYHSGTLRKKTISSSVWVVFGHGLSQVIRLGGNLILTRLLFPETFGLMALVSVVIVGANAVSDIGLRGSIVQNERGDEEVFLNTAWTIQIIRGVIMWCIACMCAWPAAEFYNAPQLAYLIPVVSLVAVIQGFGSTALFTLVRHISLRKRVIRDVGCHIVGLTIMVVCAYAWRSIWALVAGALIRPLLLMVWSHYLIPGYKNRIEFDKEAAKAIFHFGKWIFISTLLTFIGSQGDRLALGKIFSSTELGVYSIAFFLSQAIVLACQQLSGNVLFPVYTQLAKHGIGELKKKIVKIKGVLLLLTLPPTCALAVWGKPLVGFLYDPRYEKAGWMLQILAFRAIAQTLIVITERVLVANGDSFRHMILQLSRVVLLGLGMYVGFLNSGIAGLLMGMVVAAFMEYLFMAALTYRYGGWTPLLDLMAFGISGLLIYFGITWF